MRNAVENVCASLPVGVICYKIELERECCSVKIQCEFEYKGEGTPRKLATVTKPRFQAGNWLPDLQAHTEETYV
jgi:hypothetical protein